MKKLTFLYLLGILLFLTIAAFFTTNISASWTTPVKISNSSVHAVVSQVAADPKGYIHVVWDEIDDNWSRPNPGIFYSRWNGDTWSAPIKISNNVTSFADNPALAADSNGVIHAVYSDDSFGPGAGWTRIAYTQRATNGNWSTPIELPRPSGNFDYAWNAKISVDTANNLHVTFFASMNEYQIASIYHTSYNGSVWSTPELISHDTSTNQIIDTQWSVVRSDKQGNTHVIYWSWRQGVFYRKLTGATWSTPVQVTNDSDVEYTEMALDDNANPYVIWFRTNNNSVWVRRTASGVWQNSEKVSVNAIRSWWGWPIMGITTTSKGIIAAGWGEAGAGNTIDIAYQYHNGSSWSAMERVLTGRINANNPYLWRDLWDNQHLVWTELSAGAKWEQWYSVVQGTQTTIGPSGGTVTINPNNVTLATLTIPAAALSANTQITALVGPVPESVNPNNVTVPRAFTFGPLGQTFASNITAVFYYTDAELAGADPRNLGIYVWDTPTSSWSYKTGTVNTGKKTVTISDLNHFSLFGISAPRFSENSTTWEPPLVKAKSLSANAGSTIPIKFNLSYLDGSSMLVGDISVVISGGSPSQTYIFPYGDKGEGVVRYDPEEKHYILNLATKEFSPGEYTLQVKLSEDIVGTGNPSVLGTTTFTLVEEKGKPAKTTPTPTPTATPSALPSPSPTPSPSPSPTPL